MDTALSDPLKENARVTGLLNFYMRRCEILTRVLGELAPEKLLELRIGIAAGGVVAAEANKR